MTSVTAQYLTVALYVAAVMGWVAAGRRSGSRNGTVIGVALLALAGIDRLLWYSQSITSMLREGAWSAGWYIHRRWFQTVCAIAIAVGISIIWAAACRWHSLAGMNRKLRADTGLLCGIVGFCGVRALSHHHIDKWLVFEIAGLRVHWILEWTLLALLLTVSSHRLRLSGTKVRYESS